MNLKLSDRSVLDIRQRFKSGQTPKEIAFAYDVSVFYVYEILRGERPRRMIKTNTPHAIKTLGDL